MKTKFNIFINEEMTRKELADDLKDGAKYIQVDFLGPEKKWGVSYVKNGKKEEGTFNTNAEVHDFLIDNDIKYDGKDGYETIKKYRDTQISKVPFPSYQKEIIKNMQSIFNIEE